MSARVLVDLVLGFVVAEALLLAWLGTRGRPWPVRLWLPNLAAGFVLALALRITVGDAPADWTLASLLALAGVAHALDLAARSGSDRRRIPPRN